MKKFLFILVFIFITFISFSDVEIHGYFDTGYYYIGHHIVDEDYAYEYDNTIFIDIQLYFSFLGFEAGGNIKTDFEYDRIDNYIPFMNYYTIFILKKINNFEIGFSHTCIHSRLTENYPTRYDGAIRKIYLKYTF